jgi:hypothetical protein
MSNIKSHKQQVVLEKFIERFPDSPVRDQISTYLSLNKITKVVNPISFVATLVVDGIIVATLFATMPVIYAVILTTLLVFNNLLVGLGMFLLVTYVVSIDTAYDMITSTSYGQELVA